MSKKPKITIQHVSALAYGHGTPRMNSRSKRPQRWHRRLRGPGKVTYRTKEGKEEAVEASNILIATGTVSRDLQRFGHFKILVKYNSCADHEN